MSPTQTDSGLLTFTEVAVANRWPSKSNRMLTESLNRLTTDGTIAFWPRAMSLCIYPEATKTYGPVNRIGKVTGNLEILRNLKSGSRIIIVSA